jgi:hypothetical protein
MNCWLISIAAAHTLQFMQVYNGYLQVDGCTGYEQPNMPQQSVMKSAGYSRQLIQNLPCHTKKETPQKKQGL